MINMNNAMRNKGINKLQKKIELEWKVQTLKIQKLLKMNKKILWVTIYNKIIKKKIRIIANKHIIAKSKMMLVNILMYYSII